MKLSEMSAEQKTGLARENNLKPSLLKAVLGDIDLGENGKVGEVALRDYITREHGAQMLADISADELAEAASDFSTARYGHVLQNNGAENQARSRYDHVLKETK